MNEDPHEHDGFRFFTGLIAAICITTCLAGLGFTLSELIR